MTKMMTAALFAAALALTPALLRAHCGSCGMGDEKHDDAKGGKKAEHKHEKAAGKGHAAHMAAAGEAVALKGEIVDMSCWMAHDGMGEKHAKCAKECLTKGAPAGLLGADGSITLLLEGHGENKAFKLVKELGGQQAEVKGKKVTKAGITALMVTEVKKG